VKNHKGETYGKIDVCSYLKGIFQWVIARQMYGISMVFAKPPKSVMFSNPNRE
jgi:hypothetical protein